MFSSFGWLLPVALLSGMIHLLSTRGIGRRGIESRQRLGRHRYVVERSLAWLVGYWRLQVRYERRADILLVPLPRLRADLPQIAEQVICGPVLSGP